MGMVTMITRIRHPHPPSARRCLHRTKPPKQSHCSSTRPRKSVHLSEMGLDAVFVLAPPRSRHALVIPRKPVQPSSQPHNPWLLPRPRRLASPHFLAGGRLRLPAAARPTLILGTTQPTSPLEIWTTSRRSTAMLLPPIHREGLYRPTSTLMNMHTTMNPSTILTLWIWKLESQSVVIATVR